MIMSKEDFVSFEQAKRLKALGFNEPVFYRYDKDGDFWQNELLVDDKRYVCADELCYDNNEFESYFSAPTLSQACKWLRSKGFVVQVNINGARNMFYNRVIEMGINGFFSAASELFYTYEQAQSAGIDVALGLLENKNE